MSDDQFTKLSNQLAAQAAKFDDQFTKLYAHVERRFGELGTKLDDTKAEVKADINRVHDLVDQDLKRREIDEQERAAMNRQLDRQADWIEQLADSTDTKLVPEP